MNKTTEQLIQEFLDNGGKIEKLPPAEYKDEQIIGSTAKQIPSIKSLAEGELLYGKKQVKKTKEKTPDYSDINMDLIPEHLKKLLRVDKQTTKEATKEELLETDQNSRSTEASN